MAPMAEPIKIISGGQTGVDQAALRAARALGWPCGGWCPPRQNCESGTIPPQFALQETPQDCSPDAPHVRHSLRTEWNVRDAEATLILRPAVGSPDPGTEWTARCAERFGRALLLCDPSDPPAAEKIAAWLRTRQVHTLNVAGPSEATAPGIGEQAYALLLRVFSQWSSERRGTRQ